MVRGAQHLNRDAEGQIGMVIMGGFGLAVLGLFALICYGHGSDITRGLRYMFTYYPALMILAGGIFCSILAGAISPGAFEPGDPFQPTAHVRAAVCTDHLGRWPAQRLDDCE